MNTALAPHSEIDLPAIARLHAEQSGRPYCDAYERVLGAVRRGALPARAIEGATPRHRRYLVRINDAHAFLERLKGRPVRREWRLVP